MDTSKARSPAPWVLKTGLIEAADGGTAFFDEIGELPLDLQAKLLRVLQEKEFRPVGSLMQRRSDFRVIAATNRDLAKEVEKGTFRRDLFYRLNVVNVRLAPLRDRKEDIPALIAHFLGRHGRNHTLTQETLEAMISYDWPGNVRELENCIQHMVAINSGPLLHVAELPSMLQNHLMAREDAIHVGGSGRTHPGEAAGRSRLASASRHFRDTRPPICPSCKWSAPPSSKRWNTPRAIVPSRRTCWASAGPPCTGS